MEPAIDANRFGLINIKRDPSQRNKTALRAARHKAQQTARNCANNYWLQLCESIQTSSDRENIRGMANGRIPKDMLYGELITGTRTVGRRQEEKRRGE